MALPRKLRRELNDIVLNVVELDLAKESLESLKEKKRKAIAVLYSKANEYKTEIRPESDYIERLNIFEESAKQFFENGQVKPVVQTPIRMDLDKRRVYMGFVDPFTFRATIDSDEYWLQSFPGKKQPKTSLRWGFNSFGRLKSLDCKISENRMRLISVLQTNKISNEWQESEINAYPIPQDVLKLKPVFRNAETYAIYQTMIYWGHMHPNNILENLSSEKIEYIPCNPEEIPLTEIVNDAHALEMIKATASIFPYVRVDKNGRYFLRYEANRNRDGKVLKHNFIKSFLINS